MHLTAIVERLDHVCCRYRLAAFHNHFRSVGHELTFETLPRGSVARLRLFRRLRGRTVILQRKMPTFWERTWLRRWVDRLIFDFDDAIFLRDSYSPKSTHHSGRIRRFGALMRDCDAIVAGNRFLAEQATKLGRTDRVHVIPTCIDPAKYPLAWHTLGGNGVRLVWIGSSSTFQGVRLIVPLLEEIGRQVPGLRLQMICDRFLTLQQLSVIPQPWSEATEAEMIAECDIGISWVPEDLWSRGKCGLKLLQYMAAGLPVVTNPVGIHSEIVRHGETGFLVETPEQWIEAIRCLATDPAMRKRMGAAGRRRVEEHFSVALGAKLWTSVLSAVEGNQVKAG